MLKEVSKIIWLEVIKNENTSIFDEPDYLETVSFLHNTEIMYWLIYKDQIPVIGFACHIKKNIIIVPDHFSYSSFWVAKKLGEYSSFNYLDNALKALIAKYKFISFRLSPQIKDVRAFNLNGFSAKVNYTYLNNTSKFQYRKDISSKIVRAQNYELEFLNDDNYLEVLNQQIGDFKLFGFSKKATIFYKNYFDCLAKKGFLNSFSIKHKGILVASALIIIDKKKSFGYNILLSSSKKNDDLDVSAFLYDKMTAYLNYNGIETFDLYGADMKGIANFKSGFNGDLNAHYTLNYSFSNRFIYPNYQKLKLFIKKIY